jgi:hypothetical protein
LASFDAVAAGRAIYFDYEGIRTKPPVFIGWAVEGGYGGSIIDARFHDCAHRYRATALAARDHQGTVKELLERAFDEERHLVSWSWHDLKLIWPMVPRRHRDLFCEHYVNAIRVARPWHAKHFGPGLKKGYAKLSYFATAIGTKIPQRYGENVVANHIARVGTALQATGSYGALATEERASWVAATKHNRWDLQATSELCRKIRRGAPPARGFTPPAELMSGG